MILNRLAEKVGSILNMSHFLRTLHLAVKDHDSVIYFQIAKYMLKEQMYKQKCKWDKTLTTVEAVSRASCFE